MGMRENIRLFDFLIELTSKFFQLAISVIKYSISHFSDS